MNIEDIVVAKTDQVKNTKIKQFSNKGINTVEDVLNYLPNRYNDCSKLTGILPGDQISCVDININNITKNMTPRRGLVIVSAIGHSNSTDEDLIVNWYNQGWLYDSLYGCIGRTAIVAGKVTYDQFRGKYCINGPVMFSKDPKNGMAIYPIYRKISGMSDEFLQATIDRALYSEEADKEIIPADVLVANNLPNMEETYRFLHKPQSMEQIAKGQRRVVFNNLLYFALCNSLSSRESSVGSQYNIKTMALYNKLVESLPFPLTTGTKEGEYGQKEATDALIEQVRQGKRINALVQGDVGCGKTITAELIMAAFVGSGYQCAIMAPTFVLAEQHYREIRERFELLGVRVVYAARAMKAAEKRKLYEEINSGTAQIVVGTKTMLNKNIVFKNLALTVVDEEHKFGVEQRAALVAKASEGVHSITMSATPIPRSLATCIYGNNISVNTINVMPAGRQKVVTGIAKDMGRIYSFLVKQIKEHRQAYVVCPMIEDSEKMEGVRSVETVSEEFRAALGRYGVRIETLTGRNTAEETGEILDRYMKGESDILISTTVVEVGVNNPNASCIVIMSADRFGLSNLHQLRGRVGRGKYQSYCVLETESDTEKAKARLDVLCRTTDGFEIAQEDLKQRGAGDILGTQQSGANKYVELMLTYPEAYKTAQRVAEDLWDRGFDCCELTKKIMSERTDAA